MSLGYRQDKIDSRSGSRRGSHRPQVEDDIEQMAFEPDRNYGREGDYNN